jgi:hypothetical protein
MNSNRKRKELEDALAVTKKQIHDACATVRDIQAQMMQLATEPPFEPFLGMPNTTREHGLDVVMIVEKDKTRNGRLIDKQGRSYDPYEFFNLNDPLKVLQTIHEFLGDQSPFIDKGAVVRSLRHIGAHERRHLIPDMVKTLRDRILRGDFRRDNLHYGEETE